MSIELSKEEKIQIINSHIRNLVYNNYNLEIDILQENAKSTPSSSSISSLQGQMSEISDQIAALDEEISRVSALA